MSWFGILKNQINVSGLSMREMDLDNIIEDEDDDCFTKFKKTIENFLGDRDANASDASDPEIFLKKMKEYMADSVFCEILNFMKGITRNKLDSLKEEKISNNKKYVESDRIYHILQEKRFGEISAGFYIRFNKHPNSQAPIEYTDVFFISSIYSLMVRIEKDDLDGIADVIQRCVV